ncbi:MULTISPECIES: hypothetical protein [Prauserella salsuginis group]|uniref:Excreted virulence factor EspC, type VII ESX diderm n=1 Tax=Prauserella salsuginis TaxID=387889 RepID=A0ABW6G572_9PSEU|nr:MULTISPECIES: hypothetical protein [Prauserella salsuginis group]MCR3718910.1 hypothetical protein [Prauserella flava]MCR3733480.1 hypothetical protein [Prauserella salsuginis]
MAGFGAVPDELRLTAGRIAETVERAADVAWHGPGGDYGHSDIQSAWAGFMADVEQQLRSLRERADEHGSGLRDAADRYLEQEQEGLSVFSGLQEAVAQAPQAPASGGQPGRIASVLDGGR